MPPGESRRVATELGINAAEIRARAGFMGLGAEAQKDLKALREALAAEVDDLVPEFYRLLEAEPEARAILAHRGERLRESFRRYLLSLGDGIESEEYIDHRLKIGLRHEKEGISYKWYLASACRLTDLIAARLARRHAEAPEAMARSLRALHKVMALDSLLAVEAYFNAATRRLEDAHQRLEQAARSDPLTGLANRRTLLERLERAFAASERFALLVVNIDQFKAINDCAGHRFGDEALRRTAAVLRREAPSSDLAGRYGGDEFVLGLESCAPAEAFRLAEAIREAMAAEPVSLEALAETVTVSVGVAARVPEIPNLSDLMAAADGALYEAKVLGGNQTRVFRLGALTREALQRERPA